MAHQCFAAWLCRFHFFAELPNGGTSAHRCVHVSVKQRDEWFVIIFHGILVQVVHVIDMGPDADPGRRVAGLWNRRLTLKERGNSRQPK